VHCASRRVTLPQNASSRGAARIDRGFRFLTGTLSSRLLSRSPPIDRPAEAFRDITVQRRSIPARLNRSNVARTSVRCPQPMITHRSRPLFYLFHAATFFHICTSHLHLLSGTVASFSSFSVSLPPLFSLSLSLSLSLISDSILFSFFPLPFPCAALRPTNEGKCTNAFYVWVTPRWEQCVLTSELTNERASERANEWWTGRLPPLTMMSLVENTRDTWTCIVNLRDVIRYGIVR